MDDLKNKLILISELFKDRFNKSGSFIEYKGPFSNPGWENSTWISSLYRAAHINIIDSNDSGLWMMHCCIYPHYHNPSPIFGFDIFAGKNKITGCFHDFSPVVDSHDLSSWFETESSKLLWNKTRELPDWGKRIFSKSIIAAGNIQTDYEVIQISDMIDNTLSKYLSEIGATNGTVNDTGFIMNKHQSYIENQRLNPHNPRVLMSLGLTNSQAISYISECLFPDST